MGPALNRGPAARPPETSQAVVLADLYVAAGPGGGQARAGGAAAEHDP
jgi:hypothetical protein